MVSSEPRRYHAVKGVVGMLERNGDEARDERGSELPSEAESQESFEASRHQHPSKQRRRDEPWGGPHASLWKRLLAASVKASGIRIGRFPQ